MQRIKLVHFFGVRHLSPSASWHLLQFLEKVKPECILIEGPSDANELINGLIKNGVVPPIALMSYTTNFPVSSILYPFAEYSPEYQALLWAKNNNVYSAFIDLPTGVSLALKDIQNKEIDEIQDETENGEEKNIPLKEDYYNYVADLYHNVAKLSGEHTYEEYWERNFEHNLNSDAFNETLTIATNHMRELIEPKESQNAFFHYAHDLIRESYMCAKICEQLNYFEPHKIVVITGAYHTKRIQSDCLPMSEQQIATLPQRNINLTIMPYSYYRLSKHSGYGAGNSAPDYFQSMWECMQNGSLAELPAQYIGKVGRFIREKGGYCSTASMIEAVRLAYALTSLKNGNMPTLSDLHDACISCIGQGKPIELAEAFAMADIGTRIGFLPEGVSKTSIQEDFNRMLKTLKLEKYKTLVFQQLDLDLRENTKTSSEASAFLDLNRSTFLHRLRILDVGFATMLSSSQKTMSWRESWNVQWTPESEIRLVESVLKGESVEIAAAYHIKEKLENCENIAQAASLIDEACLCKLSGRISDALSLLQRLSVEYGNFNDIAYASFKLSSIIQYSDLRRTDPTLLIPLLTQLFLRASLLLLESAACDDSAAIEITKSMAIMHTISQENHQYIDDKEWINSLVQLSLRDDKNAKLSGFALSILLERNLVSDEFCAKEISKRLSLGVPASEGAAWFEGLSMRNHYALLSRIELWKALDQYIFGLEEDEFLRCVVFLRRAFGEFAPREKNSIAELLAEFWGSDKALMATFLQEDLSEKENEILEDLNEFDFDF